MCGIIGYVGREQAAPILLDGLGRLEYRGYDSAGICVGSHGGLQMEKSRGRLENLRKKTADGVLLPGTFGIGHTRWATHGQPNDVNSHPHLGRRGKIALVHNGIIENYLQLKQFLQKQGVVFASETDSEVVAQLLEYEYGLTGDLMQSVFRVLQRIEGAYALGILCAEAPGTLIAARKDAPLLLGFGDGCNFIASDATAILSHTRDVAYLEDGEVAVLTANSAEVYNAMGQRTEKVHFTVDWEASAAEKGGHAHFMFKEILEQPEALSRCVAPRVKDGRLVFADLSVSAEDLRNTRRLYIVACGSSYHVGMAGKYNLEKMLRISVEVSLASEFRYADPIVDEKTLVIVISQSGETLDTMAALREAKTRGARILSIVNVVGSSIARESDHVLYTWAGPEIAVATTKAYSAQLMVLNLLAVHFAQLLGTVTEGEYLSLVEEMIQIPEKIQKVLLQKEQIQTLASRYFDRNSVFFMGRNLDYALALEGSLKLKEISYVHSEAYASGELKHGTISLVEEGTLVVALGTYGKLFDKAMSNVVEVRARGAEVLALGTQSRQQEMAQNADGVFVIPDTADLFLPLLGVVPLQLFAYYVALHRHCDIDKPRNLAKSVTVE